MIRIRFLSNWRNYVTGEVAAFTPDLARDLIRTGRAVSADASARIEVAPVGDDTVEPGGDEEGAPPVQGVRGKRR